jgi:hypothetical protein
MITIDAVKYWTPTIPYPFQGASHLMEMISRFALFLTSNSWQIPE